MAPDNVEGSEDATKAINSEYEELFKLLKDRHEKADKNADSSDSDYDNMKWNFEEDARLREVLQRIIGFTGINIELIGRWIWIDGNTYVYKNQLKNWALDGHGKRRNGTSIPNHSGRKAERNSALMISEIIMELQNLGQKTGSCFRCKK